MLRFISGDGYNRIAVSREIIAALTQKASVILPSAHLVHGMLVGRGHNVHQGNQLTGSWIKSSVTSILRVFISGMIGERGRGIETSFASLR